VTTGAGAARGLDAGGEPDGRDPLDAETERDAGVEAGELAGEGVGRHHRGAALQRERALVERRGAVAERELRVVLEAVAGGPAGADGEAAPTAAAGRAVVGERERAPDDVRMDRGLAAVGVGQAGGRGEGDEGRAAGAHAPSLGVKGEGMGRGHATGSGWGSAAGLAGCRFPSAVRLGWCGVSGPTSSCFLGVPDRAVRREAIRQRYWARVKRPMRRLDCNSGRL
jgi:hypothetical protein